MDLDISNYNLEELVEIINLQDIPLNKGKINERIEVLNYKFRNNPKLLEFFKNVKDKLLAYFESFNEATWVKVYDHDNSAAAKVLTEQYQRLSKEEQEKNKSLLLSDSHDIIGRERLSNAKIWQTKNTIQGNKNPIQRDIIKRIVNFDSHFRQILDPSSCQCLAVVDSDCTSQANTDRRLYTATNYTIHLNQPLMNVVELELNSVQIPNSWYVFSSDYGTNKIKFTSLNTAHTLYETYTLEILNGNYTPQELEDALNVTGTAGSFTNIYLNDATTATALPKADLSGFNLIDFSYNSINNKFYIHNRDPSFNVMANFYSSDLSIDACTATLAGFGRVGDGGKVDYNLGWLLGFRDTKKQINSLTRIESISTLDITGPRYFYITLDDFNNNRPNKDLISLVDNQTSSFKLPEYFNSQSMDRRYGKGAYYSSAYVGQPGYECIDVANDQGIKCSGLFESGFKY